MTKSDPKSDDQAYQPKSYAKKKVRPGKSYVSGTANKEYPTEKKGKGYANKTKTPTDIDRDPNEK